MRNLFLNICKPSIWLICILELCLFVYMVVNYKKSKSVLMLLSACITFGLFYDALIIGLGAFINPATVPLVSRLRFVSHGVLIPLLFAICAQALGLKKPVSTIVYAITGILMVAGLAEALATVLDVVEIAGIARMASVKGMTPAWAEKISRILSFGTVIPLMITGIVVWVKQKTPYLFLSGFFMFAFSALGPATGNSDLIFFISMFGEVLMVGCLMLYALQKEKED